MADDAHHSATEGPKASWQERETSLALQRLARARANLATLEEQAQIAEVVAALDPATVARIEQLHAEMERLRPKTQSRFGGANARSKIDELEVQQRLVLERLGFSSYDDFRATRDLPESEVPAIDATMLAFARRECDDAEAAFIEIASMVIPAADPVPDEVDEPEYDAEIIDMQKPSAAS